MHALYKQAAPPSGFSHVVSARLTPSCLQGSSNAKSRITRNVIAARNNFVQVFQVVEELSISHVNGVAQQSVNFEVCSKASLQDYRKAECGISTSAFLVVGAAYSSSAIRLRAYASRHCDGAAEDTDDRYSAGWPRQALGQLQGCQSKQNEIPDRCFLIARRCLCSNGLRKCMIWSQSPCTRSRDCHTW